MSRLSRITTLTLFLSAGCNIENSLVGGRCEDGWVSESGDCVPAHLTDGEHDAGNDVVDPQADAASDAGRDGSADAELPDASTPDADLPDADLPDADVPDADILVCASPLVACRGACIPVDSDGQNCGACGKVCPSNICIAGECQGATPGDVVVIGHDFTNAWYGTPQSKILLNAASIPSSDPVRVFSYEDGAPSGSVAQVRWLFDHYPSRSFRITTASAAALESDALNLSYDVVVLQGGASADPAGLGARWATSLPRFAQKGGVVIALDTSSSNMPQLVTSAGLLSIGSHALLADGAHLVVSAPNDVVGSQVLSPYAGWGSTVTFGGVNLATPDLTVVVQEERADAVVAPVVLHRIVR